MNNSRSASYRDAGVDITAGYSAVELMKKHIARTTTPEAVSGIGDFGGLFMPKLAGMSEPVLVSGTDGVGTKLKYAFVTDKHDTIGIDCVAMCVNDIICSGARPLFFLDYIATGKLIPERAADIVKGVCDGCVEAGCALIGGETAEMPGFYAEDEYDLAGFAVGIADRSKILDKQTTQSGDVVIALPSSGFHSNGYSLVRKVFGEDKTVLMQYNEELGESLTSALLRPTVIYVKPVAALLESGTQVRGISHITGGGFFENIPRSLPEGKRIVIDKSAVRIPKVISLLQKTANIPERDMFNTFNMGVGMTVTVARNDEQKALDALHDMGCDAYTIGKVVDGERGIEL